MGELVIDFFSRTMEIINKMQIHDNKTGDIPIIKKIIQSLTPKFNFITSLIKIKKIRILMNFLLMNCKVPC
jgi:hypothetical protein